MATAAERLANNLNFGALGKATELRNRLLFTLGALIVFRLGTFLPIPGINPIALQQFFEQQSSGILGIFDTFSGGALGRMGIFALGVMPYISASIIMTLMQSSIPHLKNLKEQFLAHKVSLVFGCGGNRDKVKRHLMGAIAEKYSDFVVITSDNPRNEDMSTIISDILTGISDRDRVQIDIDRKHAIQTTISKFRKNSER